MSSPETRKKSCTAKIRPKSFDISVIIPVFNGAKWVEKCFNSILNQVRLHNYSHLTTMDHEVNPKNI